MKTAFAFRQHLITLALLTASFAASAQVTVDTDPLKTYSDQGNQVRLVPTTSPSSDLNTSTTNWTGSSVTHTNDLASLTRESRTSTADSTASGVLSGNTITTDSWAKVVSDNRFSRPSSGTISATSDSWVDNVITFSVDQLSNYSWSTTFSSMLDSTSSTDLYFLLSDNSFNVIGGCQTCTDGTFTGSGQLTAGNYALSWGGSIRSQSSTVGLLGTQFGSGEFTQLGQLTVTAVPEPETYAMFLAGLGLMGAVARRRKSKQD
jgi:hypothetical protein